MKKGFSMMEVLVALAIGGLLLVSSTDLLVSISKRWIDGPSSKDVFDAHVNGVSRFLTAVMEEATVPTLNSSGNQAIDLRRPVGFSDSEDPLIHFYLRDAPPFFVWPKGPAQRVHAYLYFEEGEGLSIAWFSELQELEKNEEGEMAPEDEDELFKTLISPFCETIHYCYYGDEDDGELDIKEWDAKKHSGEGLRQGFSSELGEGTINWDGVRKELAAIGYQGWATAEVRGGDRARLQDIAQRMDKILGM